MVIVQLSNYNVTGIYMKKSFETDEDRMIYQLKLHRDTIKWFSGELLKVGIQSQVTTGNDGKGDILLLDPKDATKAKQLIESLNNEFNKKKNEDKK